MLTYLDKVRSVAQLLEGMLAANISNFYTETITAPSCWICVLDSDDSLHRGN